MLERWNMRRMGSRPARPIVALALIFGSLFLFSLRPQSAGGQNEPFQLVEATIEDIHEAYNAGTLTAHQLVQLYLDRIETYDQQGPAINAIISVNAAALREADRLDAAFETSGFVGPLHGIPVILKDQVNAAGMRTTLGSILFEDYYPDGDAFVIEQLREAGAIILAKTTLGELGGGDTHGSLFGSTRNPYALDRTAGGSSGGSGAGVAANFATVAVGQEGFASVRRPSTWNSIVGMRPTAGLVSRTGVFDGWPQLNGSLGPMARTVTDLAKLLDAMVGYDPEDPVTARGVGHVPDSYTDFLDSEGLQGARIGVLRESMGRDSEPDSEDFAKITPIFDRAIGELQVAGAVVVDPIVIPELKESLELQASNSTEMTAEAFRLFFGRSADPPFASLEEMTQSGDFPQVFRYARNRLTAFTDAERHGRSVVAREKLMTNFLKVMADNELDAIVYKAVEHQPTLIADGVNPPYVNTKGIPYLNTFLVFVPAIVVPAGFTTDDLPAGITFMGRPYDEGTMIKLAFAYEQATNHRRPPSTTP